MCGVGGGCKKGKENEEKKGGQKSIDSWEQ